MATRSDSIVVGIKGTVVALDRATGQALWRTDLGRGDFVNVVVEDGDLFAASRGELFRLDPLSGAILWHNKLPGLGRGLVTLAGASQVPPSAEKKRRDAAAAAAAAAAAS